MADLFNRVPDLNGYAYVLKTLEASRVYQGFPIAHAGGIVFGTWLSVYLGRTIVLHGPDCPPTATTFDAVLDYGHIDAAFVVPSVLQDVSRSSDILMKLTRLTCIYYAGGACVTLR